MGMFSQTGAIIGPFVGDCHVGVKIGVGVNYYMYVDVYCWNWVVYALS